MWKDAGQVGRLRVSDPGRKLALARKWSFCDSFRTERHAITSRWQRSDSDQGGSAVRIFFSVGEPSGDLHGSNLIRELQARNSSIECVGFGGPKMAAAGCEIHEDLTKLAVMWFLRVFLNLRKFYKLVQDADRYFREHRPDAVVLIDYPGFNWHIARKAQQYDIPVFYYGAPQMWAWASWRINKMRRLVDHVLCKLPFEAKWYQNHGCRATYVGHPYFDEMRQLNLDQAFLSEVGRKPGKLVTILPGSRKQEVHHNLKWFLKTAGKIVAQVPGTRFAIASFNEQQARLARELVADSKLPIEVHVGRTQELIQLADCCLACSGSVSLELMYHEKPTVILYHVSPGAYFVQQFFRKVKYITLVNLLAAAELYPKNLSPFHPDQPDAANVPMPEYLTWRDRSTQMATHIVSWLTSAEARDKTVQLLQQVKAQVAEPGASRKAAEYLFKELAPVPAMRPHFLPDGSKQRVA